MHSSRTKAIGGCRYQSSHRIQVGAGYQSMEKTLGRVFKRSTKSLGEESHRLVSSLNHHTGSLSHLGRCLISIMRSHHPRLLELVVPCPMPSILDLFEFGNHLKFSLCLPPWNHRGLPPQCLHLCCFFARLAVSPILTSLAWIIFSESNRNTTLPSRWRHTWAFGRNAH